MAGLKVNVIRPQELGAAERALWARWQGADPALASPFLSVGYALTAGEIAPSARVAVVLRDGATVAFLPYQRRGGLLQPLGAPLTDYHGLIARPGTSVDLAHVVRGAGGSSYLFSGLVGAAPAAARARTRTRVAIDMPEGFEAWYAGRRTKWAKYFKDKERAARSLERDHGAPEVRLHDDAPDVFDFIVSHKRAQYRLTGQHDVFACGWTERLLRRLLETRAATAGARIATLRVGGRLAAAEYSLRDGAHNHFWFPVYAAEFARYSCGTLLSLRTLELAAADGVTWGDYGLDAEGYKKYFAEPVGTVLEGAIAAGARPRPATAGGAAHGWRAKAERRMAVILACETDWTRAAAAAGQAVATAAAKRLREAAPTGSAPTAA